MKSANENVPCPECFEPIPAGATRCRYCGFGTGGGSGATRDDTTPDARSSETWDDAFASIVGARDGAGERAADGSRRSVYLVAGSALLAVLVLGGVGAVSGLFKNGPPIETLLGNGRDSDAAAEGAPTSGSPAPMSADRSAEIRLTPPPVEPPSRADREAPGDGATADAPPDRPLSPAAGPPSERPPEAATVPADTTVASATPDRGPTGTGRVPADAMAADLPSDAAPARPGEASPRPATDASDDDASSPTPAAPPRPATKPEPPGDALAIPPARTVATRTAVAPRMPPDVKPAPSVRAPSGGGAPRARVGSEEPVTAVGDLVIWVQRELSQRGYYSGPVNGRAGPKTHDAIRAYQRASRLTPNGRIDPTLVASLRRTANSSRSP